MKSGVITCCVIERALHEAASAVVPVVLKVSDLPNLIAIS